MKWTMALICAAVTSTACGAAQTTSSGSAATLPATATCPVMKETFKPSAKTKTYVYKGKTYYFCCPGCDGKFKANPTKYLAAAPSTAATPKAAPKPDCGKDCDDCDDKQAPAVKDAGTTGAAKTTPAKLRVGKAGAIGATLPDSTKCIVSGQPMKPTAASLAVVVNGKSHFFCCPGCMRKFANDPNKFLGASK